jgi:hypothetical protein
MLKSIRCAEAKRRADMQITWDIKTPESHSVRMEQSSMSGAVKLLVDGRVVFEPGMWWTGGDHTFQIDGVPCILRAKSGMMNYNFELWVNGKQV